MRLDAAGEAHFERSRELPASRGNRVQDLVVIDLEDHGIGRFARVGRVGRSGDVICRGDCGRLKCDGGGGGELLPSSHPGARGGGHACRRDPTGRAGQRPAFRLAATAWSKSLFVVVTRGTGSSIHFIPMTMESGPTRCSTRHLLKPASRSQPMQSDPV